MFCYTSLSIYGQEAVVGFDGHKWEAPYYLPIPQGWTTERFLIPISFAPQISYKGVEDIRFSPGWGKAESEEYWTYAFLWYLDSAPETNAKIIAENLRVYYTGLIQANTDSKRISTGEFMPVTSSFEKVPTDKNDTETFAGTIEMTDYMQLKPMLLNCVMHLKFCPETDKTILFYEISPKPLTHKNWQSLDKLWSDFRCKKN